MTSINKQIKNSVNNLPMPFQWEVIRFILDQQMRCFCFLDMGLGKSFCSLAALAVNPTLRPALIVCPASLKINWQKEAKMHIDENAIVLSSKKPEPLTYPGIYVINYDVVSAWKKEILKADFKVMIADECQYLKNQKAIRTKACKHLSMHIPHIIGLTGTPITNRPVDLFSPLDIVKPGLFPSWFAYVTRYCNMKRRPWGMDVSGASHLDELHEKISPYFIRRKKEDVLTDLPPRQTIVMPMDITNRKEYKKAEGDFLKWLKKVKPEKLKAAEKAEALVKINTLRMLLVEGKMKGLEEWVDNYLESEKKLILFMVHTEPLHKIYNTHKKHAVIVDGSVSAKKRNIAVEKFQNDDKVKLFCGNIKAAGVGLTLTAADTLVFGELGDLATDHAQAADRNYRIGQKQNVQCYYMIAHDTYEEQICERLHRQMKVIDQILDGEITDSQQWDFNKELMAAMKQKK